MPWLCFAPGCHFCDLGRTCHSCTASGRPLQVPVRYLRRTCPPHPSLNSPSRRPCQDHHEPHPRHHPHRLPRLGQDHAAQARAERGPRPEDRRHRERVRRREHRQRHPGHRDQGADHPDEQRLHLLHHPRRPARHAAAAGRQEAQGPAGLRPRGDRDHRPGRPGPGGADLLHGRRDRRELPARLHPDAGGRQARRPAAQRPPGGAPPGRASPTRSSSARPTWWPRTRSTR